MPLINFPNLPRVPGVPNIPRLASPPAVTRLISGTITSALFRAFQVSDKWGILKPDGSPLVDSQNLLNAIGVGSILSTKSMEYSKETRIADFPIEKGAFASYNKVEMPSTPTVIFTFQGSESERRSFLDQIEAATISLDLFTVITPEVTYINHAIESYNYRRSSTGGTTLLTVEIVLKQIRQSEAKYITREVSEITTPKDAGAARTIDSGKVQVKKPDVSTLKSLANKFGL